MDQNYGGIINELKEKINILLTINKGLKEENLKLIIENKRIIDDLKDFRVQKNEIEEKYEKVRLAKTILGNSEDTHSAKLKINRIVREIDKCIALLNK